jgi:hypothetical protein
MVLVGHVVVHRSLDIAASSRVVHCTQKCYLSLLVHEVRSRVHGVIVVYGLRN